MDRQILLAWPATADMVDVASLFGIGFIVVTLLMTAALTWLGLAEGEFDAVSDEDGEGAGT